MALIESVRAKPRPLNLIIKRRTQFFVLSATMANAVRLRTTPLPSFGSGLLPVHLENSCIHALTPFGGKFSRCL